MRIIALLFVSFLIVIGNSFGANNPESNGATSVIKETKTSKRITNITQKIEKKLAKKSKGGDYRMPTIVVILVILLLLLLLGSTLVSLLIFALVLFLIYFLLVQGGFI